MKKGEQGFTLIELSIVLVIIGLIIGGVLVGQDMIKAAEVRATVAQYEKYNSAVNTFRSKYNSIPGDITGGATGQAAAFGLFTETTLGGQAGHGDGNGLLESDLDGNGAGAAVVGLGNGETLTFWRHLTDANLIDGAFGITGNSLIVAADGTPTAAVTNMLQSVPPAKLGRGNAWIVYAQNGLNYYHLGAFTGIADPAGTYTLGASMVTPTEAFNIDSKVDDGAPNTGVVRARAITAPITALSSFAGASTGNTCMMNPRAGALQTDNDNTYNRVAATGGNDPSCALRLQFN
jgi:prepilin-type N-terminal cleavage/methylation domain-containing protein